MNTPLTIVFVCEHAAAKSVIAAAYFNQLAKQKGLNLQAIARGTHPDEALSPNTVKGLMEDGLTLPVTVPQKLPPIDLDSTKLVVSFCDLSKEDIHPAVKVEQWDDVPPVGESYQIARDAILKNLNHLIGRLESADE